MDIKHLRRVIPERGGTHYMSHAIVWWCDVDRGAHVETGGLLEVKRWGWEFEETKVVWDCRAEGRAAIRGTPDISRDSLSNFN